MIRCCTCQVLSSVDEQEALYKFTECLSQVGLHANPGNLKLKDEDVLDTPQYDPYKDSEQNCQI